MNQSLKSLLTHWKHPVLTSADLTATLDGTAAQRHSLIKRLLKNGTLVQLKRGVYLIGQPFNQSQPDSFEIAPLLYGPSYISFESALSHYGWIPEAVYTTTSATSKKHKKYNTPVGRFTFEHTPTPHFMLGVNHIETEGSSYLLATPWKAIADICYFQRKKWSSTLEISSDLRIDPEDLQRCDLLQLENLSRYYSSKRVRQVLQALYKELQDANRHY